MILRKMIQSNRSIAKVIFAVLLGLWASLGIVRILMWKEPRTTQTILFVAFAAIVTLIYYKFILCRSQGGLSTGNKKAFIVSIVIGWGLVYLLLSFSDVPLPLEEGASQQLEIIPLKEEDQFFDVALMEVKIDGKKIPLGKFVRGSGWEVQDGTLVYTGGDWEGATYTFKNLPESQVVLLFREGPQMGSVSIVINGKEMKKVNLFGNAKGETLVTVQSRGIVGPYWLVILLKTMYGLALLPATFIPSWTVWVLPAKLRNAHPHPYPTGKVNPNWQFLLQVEFLLAGIFLCWNSLFTIRVSTSYSLALNFILNPLLLAVGLLVLIIGIFILPIPKISGRLWNNQVIAYLVTAHFWILLSAIIMELVVRLSVYSPPLTSVYTNWFGSVNAKGSFLISGREGYAITHYDGPPGEIHTPFQGGDNIVLLGDSFMEGAQVSDSQKFVSVAEIALRQDGYYIDLHNMGDSGDAMADYVNKIYGYRALYNPVAIVVELSENDFIESFSRSKTSYFIVNDSKIVDVYNKNKIGGVYAISDSISYRTDFTLQKYGKMRLDQITQRIATNTEDDNSLKVFDENLAGQQMELLLKACGDIPIIIVMIPHAPYISGNEIEMKNPKHDNLKTFLLNYPQVTLIDPLPAFQELSYTGVLPSGFTNSPIAGSGHLNRHGNEVLGKLLSEGIKEVLK